MRIHLCEDDLEQAGEEGEGANWGIGETIPGGCGAGGDGRFLEGGGDGGVV